MTEQNPFKWRHFQAEIILLRVRWYLRYSLSYRDLEEMMAERKLCVDHTTIYCIHLVPRGSSKLLVNEDAVCKHRSSVRANNR